MFNISNKSIPYFDKPIYFKKPKKKMVMKPTIVKNPKIARNIEDNFNKWHSEQFPSRVVKKEVDPRSISSLKKFHRTTRSKTREIEKIDFKGFNLKEEKEYATN